MNVRLGWLAWRFVTHQDYNARLRAGLLFAGVAIISAVALFGAAMPGALQAHATRAATLELAYGDPETTTDGGTPTETGVLGLAGDMLPDRRWDGFEVERVVVAAQDPDAADDVLIPGVKALPGPGEVYISSALASKAVSEPTLAALLSGYRVAGEISPAGLVSPTELRMVIGAPPSTVGLQPVVGLGVDEERSGYDSGQVVNRSIGLLATLLVAIPAIAFIALCARLGSRQRAGRITGLRCLGLSRRQVRTVLVAETLMIAAPACLTGIALYLVVIFTVQEVPGTQFGFFRSDVTLSPVEVVMTLAAVLMVAAASAAAGTSLPDTGQHSTRTSAQIRSSLSRGASAIVGYVLLAGAVVMMIVLPQVNGAPGVTPVLVWVTLAMAALGLGLAAAPLTARISRVAAAAVTHGGWLAGFRINTAEPGTTSRLTVLAGVLILGISSALATLGNVNGSSNTRVSPGESQRVVVSVHDFGKVLSTSEVADAEGVQATTAVVYVEGSKDTVMTVRASCEDLGQLLGHDIGGCRDDQMWWLSKSGAAPRLSKSRSMPLPNGTTAELPDSAQTLATEVTDLLDGMLLTPMLVAGDDAGEATRYLVSVRAKTSAQTLAGLAALAPTAGFVFGEQATVDSDTQEFTSQTTWLTIGALLAMTITLLALVVSISGETPARRDRLRGLYVLGASARDLTRAHFALTMFPLALISLLAVLLSWVFNLSQTALNEAYQLNIVPFVLTAVLALLIAAITALVTLPPLLHPLRSAHTE